MTWENACAAQLFIAIKDHNHADANLIAAKGYARALKRCAGREGFDLRHNTIELPEGEDFSKEACNVWIIDRINKSLSSKILDGLRKIKHLFSPKIINHASGELINSLCI